MPFVLQDRPGSGLQHPPTSPDISNVTRRSMRRASQPPRRRPLTLTSAGASKPGVRTHRLQVSPERLLPFKAPTSAFSLTWHSAADLGGAEQAAWPQSIMPFKLQQCTQLLPAAHLHPVVIFVMVQKCGLL